MAQILITKPGTLTAKDVDVLRQSGVVTIEAETPADVRMIDMDRGELSGSDMVIACLRAIASDCYNDNVAAKFPKILLEAMQASREASHA